MPQILKSFNESPQMSASSNVPSLPASLFTRRVRQRSVEGGFDVEDLAELAHVQQARLRSFS